MMDIFTQIFDLFSDFILNILPVSPFENLISQFASLPYLGYLNWFVPVADIIGTFGLWLTAYGLYLVYSIVYRWLKVIGD